MRAGFPDSPCSYRYLLPALGVAGYRAVAPFNRGFTPAELPDDRHHLHTSTMVADQIALHEALGDDQAILIAHDWGAVGAWRAAGQEPGRWRRCIILNIPPFAIFSENIVTYDQIKRSFYFWYFQMQRVCEDVISAGNFAFTDRIWATPSPRPPRPPGCPSGRSPRPSPPPGAAPGASSPSRPSAAAAPNPDPNTNPRR